MILTLCLSVAAILWAALWICVFVYCGDDGNKVDLAADGVILATSFTAIVFAAFALGVAGVLTVIVGAFQ
ncbi:MAG: hypothetical protein OEZ19_00870 [Paracoccaceae bacterium]|nr:hypothetical protein [Paracoccaceae bacterium]